MAAERVNQSDMDNHEQFEAVREQPIYSRGGPRRLWQPNENFSHQQGQLYQLFDDLASNDPARRAPDEAMAAFYSRAANSLDKHQRLRFTINELVGFQDPQLNPKDIANRYFRAIQAIAQGQDSVYHLRDKDADYWDKMFATANSSDMWGLFDTYMHLPVGSNKPDRGKTIPLIANLHGKTKPLTILEVGCSQNLILKKLAMLNKGRFKLGPTKVIDHIPVDKTDQPEENYVQTDTFKYLVNQGNFALAYGVGIDAMDPAKDEILQDYHYSSSFYPKEQISGHGKREYQALARLALANVHFVPATIDQTFNVKDFRRRLKREFHNIQQFDIVAFITSMYQNSDEVCQEMLEATEPLTKPDGLRLMQDFVVVNNGFKFLFQDNWNWTYTANVQDMSKRDEGFKHYLTYDGGRAEKVVLGPGLSELDRAQELGLVAAA